ncbi:MAG: hypothetical protein QGG64_01810, partial [Candidatus Latescibacteria bacterium]|nr:hypothetical protein [Candidatus Latescibacterota bacterium]
MRWSLTLCSPHLVADERPFDSERLVGSDCSLTLGPDDDGRSAWVGISWDGQFLEVGVVAMGLENFGARPDHEEWYNRAHLAVMLNPGHDHVTRWICAIDDRGEIVNEAHFACPGEELGDDAARLLEVSPCVEGTFRYLDDRRFFAQIRIAGEGLWPQVGPAGLSLRVGFHEIPIPDSLAWPERVSWTKDTPLVFGDLYRKESEFTVSALDIPRPTWGGDPSPVRLMCCFGKEGVHKGQARIRIDLPGDGIYDQDVVKWTCEGNEDEIEIPITFPFRAKWSNGLMNVARLHLDVMDENGESLWTGAFPFGFDTGIIVREQFGQQGKDVIPRPEPDDPDFLDAFRSYVLSRLPDYVMQTTREGASSDFYLRDRDGLADLDLSAEDALDQAAAMIAGAFPNWQDALCAAAMWVHHPCITRHSSTWSRVSNAAEIATIPRLAGCFCGDTTRLTALLAEKIGFCLKVPLRGLSMGLRG